MKATCRALLSVVSLSLFIPLAYGQEQSQPDLKTALDFVAGNQEIIGELGRADKGHGTAWTAKQGDAAIHSYIIAGHWDNSDCYMVSEFFAFSLKAFDPDHITVNGKVVRAYTSDGKSTVSWIFDPQVTSSFRNCGFSRADPMKTETKSYLEIAYNDSDYAQRAAKALAYAIRSVGGKSSPF